MLYPLVLFVHSWLRWGVLAAAIYVIARASLARAHGRTFTAADEKTNQVFVGLVDLQFTLGFLLYVWLSPIVRGAFADMSAAMKSAPLRFFAIEHITAMFVAVSCVHVAQVRRRRQTLDAARHRIASRGAAAFLAFALIGIPWPGLKQARPLARLSILEESTAEPAEPDVYRLRCAPCHGPTGKGDGLAAKAMQPPPRNLSDAAWQARTSDAEIAQVIRGGGLARAMSANMPPHPDLKHEQVAELVQYVRSLQTTE